MPCAGLCSQRPPAPKKTVTNESEDAGLVLPDNGENQHYAEDASEIGTRLPQSLLETTRKPASSFGRVDRYTDIFRVQVT